MLGIIDFCGRRLKNNLVVVEGVVMDFYKELNDVLDPAPPRIIRKTVMVPTAVDICPHCNEEIKEKSTYMKDNRYFHNCCKFPIRSSVEAEQEAVEFTKRMGLNNASKE